jgi:RHS repeat-associated protein
MFFDNLVVEHHTGPLVEENAYYPFGLVQQGISSKAFGRLKNKEKTFQAQRFDDELGLDWVQFIWRNHDPQIGRFIEIDPLANEYVYNSTYAFSENKVTSHVELEGLEASPSPATTGGTASASAIVLVLRGGSAIVSAPVAIPVVTALAVQFVIEHPEILISGGASAGQMDLKVERQLRQYSSEPFVGEAAAPKLLTNAVAGVTNHVVRTKAAGEKRAAANTQTGTANGKQGSSNKPTQNQQALPKPPKGKGSVPPNQRDPKRVFSNKEKTDMLEKQNGACVGCGQQKSVEEVAGHHIIRHADGGKTVPENGAALCKDCHTEIHQ